MKFDVECFFSDQVGSSQEQKKSFSETVIVKNIQLILEECNNYKLLPAQAAYVLATAWHETGAKMLPIRETFAETDDEAIARLDRAWNAGKLPQVKQPYWRKDARGQAWFGRGFVQLTHKENYKKVASLIGQPIDLYPHLALNPVIAAKILVVGMVKGVFTGYKLNDFINKNKIDFVNARKIINGLDRANKIAKYAEQFLLCIDV